MAFSVYTPLFTRNGWIHDSQYSMVGLLLKGRCATAVRTTGSTAVCGGSQSDADAGRETRLKNR